MAEFKKCEVCGKEYSKSPHYSYKQWELKKYCSRKCKCVASRTYLRKEKPIRICEFCGKKFICDSMWDYNKRKYCNMGCSSKAFIGFKFNQKQLEKLSKSHIGKPAPWNSGKKCNFWRGGISKKTRGYRKLLMSSREYRNWRKAVLEKDAFRCVKCGSKQKLHVHHIKSFIKYPELRFLVSNGEILCIDCHKKTDTYARHKFGELSLNEIQN